ncbi:MAG: DUF4255 domain-containing protein [Anaerolineales bacterium]|nr:DUF4255 domain-containing protein [Anaerolineales bacterium]
MIADLDETIRQLLIAEMPVKNGEIEISFHLPKREWSTRLNKPTVNFFLYDLRENPTLRAPQWERLPGERLPGGNGNDKQARLKRSPMRVDCFYMLTTWAAEPEDEHRLMTRCLMALFRFPILPAERLVGSLKNPPFDIQARLALHDRLTNPAEVWSALDNEMRPSVPYVITLALDPWTEVTGSTVHTLFFRYGQAEALPDDRKLAAGTQAEQVYMGGTVRQGSQEGAPLAGIQVAVKGTGLFATTNAAGRYVLGSLPAGDYILVAWPKDGKPKEKKVSLSVGADADGSNYDIEL